MKIKTVIIRLLQIISVIGTFLLVFWSEGHAVDIIVIYNKITNPHNIDMYDDIIIHTKPMLITISIYLNMIAIDRVLWFFRSLNNGTVRWGGKSGND